MLKIVLILGVIAAILAVVLLFLNFNAKTDLLGQLRSMGYETKVKEVTYRGYESKNISAEKDGEKVLIQTVNNVKKDKVGEILTELTTPVVDASKDISVFDPYTAQEVTLNVPEELKPIKKEVTIQGQTVPYYLVHANIIISLRVYAETEVRYKGLFASYFCENNNTAYKLEIYYPLKEEFNEEKAINLFSSLFCTT